MFKYFQDIIEWAECHREGSCDVLLHALRYARPGAHAPGPEALLQTCFPAVPEGQARWRLRSCTEQQINLAVAWMQFIAYKTDCFPVQFWSRSGFDSIKKTFHAWVRQPNTIVVKTLRQGPFRGHGHCSSHGFIISAGNGFPCPPRSLWLLLGPQLWHLYGMNGTSDNLCLRCNSFCQQATLSIQHDWSWRDVSSLRSMPAGHWASLARCPISTFCVACTGNGPDGLNTNRRAPAPTLWFSDL